MIQSRWASRLLPPIRSIPGLPLILLRKPGEELEPGGVAGKRRFGGRESVEVEVRVGGEDAQLFFAKPEGDRRADELLGDAGPAEGRVHGFTVDPPGLPQSGVMSGRSERIGFGEPGQPVDGRAVGDGLVPTDAQAAASDREAEQEQRFRSVATSAHLRRRRPALTPGLLSSENSPGPGRAFSGCRR